MGMTDSFSFRSEKDKTKFYDTAKKHMLAEYDSVDDFFEDIDFEKLTEIAAEAFDSNTAYCQAFEAFDGTAVSNTLIVVEFNPDFEL